MHSVLIIGCGSIGERHLRCFQRTGRAQVIACDANPGLAQEVGHRYGVPTASNWRQAFAENSIDLAVVCTPAHLHVQIATDILRLGHHVLIEKPLSVSFTGMRELLQTARASNRQCAVAYTYRVFPFLVQAREFLRTGELGPVKLVTSVSGQAFAKMRATHTQHYSQTYYRDHRTGGGAIQDALTHVANFVESIIGPTDSVMCDCAHQVLPGVTVEDTVNVTARHGPALVNYSLNQFQAPNEGILQFHCPGGSVKIEFHWQRWGIFRADSTEWEWHSATVPDRDSHFLRQAELFLDQVEGQISPLCSLEEACQTLRFNLAALKSAETHARVECAPIHE